MGNAPLPNPPAPASNKVVIPITTIKNSVWDTELQLMPPLLLSTTTNPCHHQDQSENQAAQVAGTDDWGDDEVGMRDGTIELSDIPSSTPPPVASQSNYSITTNIKYPFPPQLQQRQRTYTVTTDDPSAATTVDSYVDNAYQNRDERQQQALEQRGDYYYVVPPNEYQEKLQALQSRLKQWQGGKVNTFIGIISMLIVLTFTTLWLFHPTFWISPFARNGFAGLLLASILVIFYGCMFRWSKQETARLFADVDDIFRTWRRNYYVSVKMKRVSHIRMMQQNGKPDIRSIHCYCLEINVVDVDDFATNGGQVPGDEEVAIGPEAGLAIAESGGHSNDHDDTASLGTFNTNGSDELEAP